MKNKYIVGLGELLWDVLPDGKKIGGAPGNFAYHISQFGFNGAVVSALGRDELGDEIASNLETKGLGGVIERVDYPTGTVQVSLDSQGIPVYEIKKNVAWDNIPFSDKIEQLAKKTIVVSFGSLAQRNLTSRKTINSFLDAMPSGKGRYKIFDINLRQRFYTKAAIKNSLDKCNILKINDEELVVVSKMFGYKGLDDQQQCLRLFNDYKLEILILTCGTLGSYVFTDGNVSFVATPKVEVADTVGAGDSFTATFIASILGGETIKDAHMKAVRVSAYVCTQHGAMPEIPEQLK